MDTAEVYVHHLSPSFAVKAVRTTGGTRLMLSGELDRASIDDLTRCLDQICAVEVDPAPERFVVDAIALRFMDPAGARAFVRFCDRLTDRGTVEISWLQPDIRQALALAGVQVPTGAPSGRPRTLWVGATPVD